MRFRPSAATSGCGQAWQVLRKSLEIGPPLARHGLQHLATCLHHAIAQLLGAVCWLAHGSHERGKLFRAAPQDHLAVACTHGRQGVGRQPRCDSRSATCLACFWRRGAAVQQFAGCRQPGCRPREGWLAAKAIPPRHGTCPKTRQTVSLQICRSHQACATSSGRYRQVQALWQAVSAAPRLTSLLATIPLTAVLQILPLQLLRIFQRLPHRQFILPIPNAICHARPPRWHCGAGAGFCRRCRHCRGLWAACGTKGSHLCCHCCCQRCTS